MIDALKTLFENDVVSEEIRAQIEEAWETKVVENRRAATAELREEFAQKYEHDKATMVEAIDTLLSERLAEEIAELTKKFIASSATKAAYSMFEVMNNPTDLGNKEKMAAAKDVLDRSGFTKTEKVEVSAASPLFILPQKSDEDE